MFLKPVSLFSLNCKYRGVDKSLALPGRKQANVSVRMAFDIYRGDDKILARPGRKKANVCVRMA